MMTTRARLHMHVYAPALTSDDGRPLAAVEGMERAVPGLRLAWRVSDAGRPVALPDRAAWLAESAADGEFGLLCNGDERYPVMLDGQMVKLPWNIRSPKVPQYLGWINYWSAATAEAIGFPDPSRDAELLARARRTASGGWVVSLTAVPLDLDKPAHVEVLKRAYDRFREVGGRGEA